MRLFYAEKWQHQSLSKELQTLRAFTARAESNVMVSHYRQK